MITKEGKNYNYEIEKNNDLNLSSNYLEISIFIINKGIQSDEMKTGRKLTRDL